MKIRSESKLDIDAVWQLNSQAFPTQAEADLVNALRRRAECISLVAEVDSQIVGHILFSPVNVNNGANLTLVGLGPMAVSPELQNSGIGTRLVQRGISDCRDNCIDAIVVLGHPNYYPRFGFQPSVNFGIKSEYDVPDDVFMIQELTPKSLAKTNGTIKYHDAFKSL